MLYFLGFLLVFPDYPIELAYGGVLNVIPDFLGYAILLLACLRDARENVHFRRMRYATFVALPLSIAEFSLALAVPTTQATVSVVMGVALTVVSLYVTYTYAEGAKALEKRRYQKLDADKIASAWFILTMASLLMYLALYLLPAVLLPCNLVYILAILWLEGAVFQFEKKLSSQKRS